MAVRLPPVAAEREGVGQPRVYLALGPAGQILEANGEGALEQKLAARLPLGKNFLELVHRDDRAAVAAGVAIDRHEGVGTPSVPFQLRGGAMRWVSMQLIAACRSHDRLSLTLRIDELAEARRAEGQLRQVVEGARHGIVVTAADGRTLYMNAGFARMVGFETVEALLAAPPHPTRYIHPDDLPLIAERQQARASRVEAPSQYEFRLLRCDGGVVWAETLSSTIVWNGEPASSAWLTDITERKQNEEALRHSKEAAERANRIKGEFLANMSHEIRTPMSGVIGMTELLLKMPLGDAQRECAEIVRDSAAALMTVINDILDISKLDAGKVELEAIDFDLAALVDNVVGLTRPPAEQKGLSFRLMLDPKSRALFRGDPTRLRQILLNLISNAVKFTERGEVTIALAIRPEAEPPAIRIDVADSGIGMDEATRQRVFEKFTQADSSVTRRFGGTGLGLAISRELVELMGGRIGVASRLGDGSLFWVELPLAPAETGSPTMPVPAQPGGAARPLRVLLAEDNQINQKIVRALLVPAGHAVDIVSDGAAAVDAVRDGGYDLVLMDVQMPVLDGPEATRRIRALPPPSGKIHIIALTAHAMVGARDEYLAAGMDDYLTKPIDQAALLARLAKLSPVRP